MMSEFSFESSDFQMSLGKMEIGKTVKMPNVIRARVIVVGESQARDFSFFFNSRHELELDHYCSKSMFYLISTSLSL